MDLTGKRGDEEPGKEKALHRHGASVPARVPASSSSALLVALCAAGVGACKTPRQSVSAARGDEPALATTTSPDSLPDGALADDPYEAGFAIARPAECNCPKPGETWTDDTWQFAVLDDRGLLVPDPSQAQSRTEGLALDTGAPGDDPNAVVFTWPKATEIIDRNFVRLEALVTEYSRLVGTCDGSTSSGFGETSWLTWIRSDQARILEEAAVNTRSSELWCKEVVRQLVDRYVPTGSRYRQYGNCGEGGRVAACLAKRSGFADQEIRLCRSANDHFFAMVFRGVEGPVNHRWCLLDRWPVVGANFACGYDIAGGLRRFVAKDGVAVTDSRGWYDNLTCTTLESYIREPSSFAH
jgi:hypothetical protein